MSAATVLSRRPREAWWEGFDLWLAIQDDRLAERGLRTITDIYREVCDESKKGSK